MLDRLVEDTWKPATTLTLLDRTLNERIARVTDATCASRHVINDTANSQSVTRAGTRISAFAIDARQLTRAFAVTDALWSAVGRRSAELWHAGARRRVVDDLTLGIGTAWRGLARVYRFRCIFRFKMKENKSCHVFNTFTHTYKDIFDNRKNLRLGIQRMNGSPVNTGGQLQIGL